MSRVARLVLVAAAALLVLPPELAVAETSQVSGAAQARPASRPVRKNTKRATRSTTGAGQKTKTKLRADRGQVRADRSPLKAKVATGDQVRATKKSGKAGRVDVSKLPLSEQIAIQIEELLRGPLRAGTTSLFVADAITGKPVFSVYPDDPLNPASNVKLIATATALDLLGPDYRYTTRVLGQTPDDQDGVLADGLYLLGSYDPTFAKTSIEGLARQLVDAGLTRLDGDVVVGPTPTRDGMYRSFVDLTITAAAPGEPVTVVMEPPTDFVKLVVTATTSKKKRPKPGISVTNEYVTDELGHKRLEITVSGQIAQGKSVVRDVWMKERAYFAAHLLRGALRELGVEVTGDVRVGELREYVDTALLGGYIPMPLAEHRSQRLAEIVQRVNKRSTNWLADRVIMTAAAKRYGGKPDMKTAVDAMYRWLEKKTDLTREDVVIDTGSGLSYKTELSARQVVTVLRAALGLEEATALREEKVQTAYRNSLAIGGVDGTIRKRFKTLDATVLGKTGTLLRVVSLAGVIEVDGRQLVFSVISNGHESHWKGRIRDGHERLIGLLCEYLHKLPPEDGATKIAEPAAPAPVEHVEAPPSIADEIELIDETDEESTTETADQ
jgi:serine-type D-Ala-D-Ala carboxypeptidase/endopeptidase (penicillin-binding protein 4)